MTFKKLCLEIAKREGKKEQLTIAQIREVMSILSDICFHTYDIHNDENAIGHILFINGLEREDAKLKQKPKRKAKSKK